MFEDRLKHLSALLFSSIIIHHGTCRVKIVNIGNFPQPLGVRNKLQKYFKAKNKIGDSSHFLKMS